MTPDLPDLSGLENIAVGKPASQSSMSRWSRPNDPARAVNGRRSGGFAFHTDEDKAPWWQLDLLAPTPVRFVVVWNRQDSALDRTRDLAVETSLDGETWSVLHHTGDQTFGGVRDGKPLVVPHDGAPFRFLRLRRTVPGYLHLDEVEVYAPASADRSAWRALREVLGEEEETEAIRARQTLRIRFGGHGERSGPPRTLSIKPGGRFGNDFLKLIHAIHVARQAGITRIHLGKVNPTQLTAPRMIGGIEFSPAVATGRDGPDLYGLFFSRHTLPRCYERLSPAETVAIVETYLRPLFDGFFEEPPPAAVPTLHVHIRSGDIFVHAHPQYTQPPLAFYRLAIGHAVAELGVAQVVLVHSNDANPCIPALRAWLDAEGIRHTSQSASLRADLAALIGAEHMIVSRGTFTLPAMTLSTRMRTVYAFREDAVLIQRQVPGASLLAERGIRVLNVVDEGEGFTPENGWRNSPAQRDMMLDYPIDSLRLVEFRADATVETRRAARAGWG